MTAGEIGIFGGMSITTSNSVRAAQKQVTAGYVAMVHPDVAADLAGVWRGDPAREIQESIRNALRRNQTRRRKGNKHKGAAWVAVQRAQCAIMGHDALRREGKCYFCGASIQK